MDKYYVKIEGDWYHRAPVKVILNPILRWLQFWKDDPYVIVSITERIITDNGNNSYHFVRFGFMRKQYRNFK